MTAPSTWRNSFNLWECPEPRPIYWPCFIKWTFNFDKNETYHSLNLFLSHYTWISINLIVKIITARHLKYFVHYIILIQTKASLVSLFTQDILDIIRCCFILALLSTKMKLFKLILNFKFNFKSSFNWGFGGHYYGN